MSPEEAVLEVLGDADEPLHWTVIQDPDVRGAVLTAVRALVVDGRVVKTATGVYALAG